MISIQSRVALLLNFGSLKERVNRRPPLKACIYVHRMWVRHDSLTGQ